MTISDAYVKGRVAAFGHYKLGWPAPTNPTVANSAVLRSKSAPSSLSPVAQQNLKPPTDPQQVAQIFNAHEQGESRSEPHRKLSAEDLCTTCRKTKHYGPCSHPRAIPTKAADFNMGMLGSDPSQQNNPSTSPNYHSATSGISALARASDGRPADEQAATGFADLFRHQGIRNSADEPGRMYGGLNKVSGLNQELQGVQLLLHGGVSPQGALEVLYPHAAEHIPPGLAQAAADRVQAHDLGREAARLLSPKNPTPQLSRASAQQMIQQGVRLRGPQKLADFMLPGSAGHSMHEQRGPSVNPYEERRTRMSPPIGWGAEGEQRIDRMFREFDNQIDTTNIGGGFGDPQPGPAALG